MPGGYWIVGLKKTGDSWIWEDGIEQAKEQGVYPWLTGRPSDAIYNRIYGLLIREPDWTNDPLFLFDNKGGQGFWYICSPQDSTP